MEEILVRASEVPWDRVSEAPQGMLRKVLSTGPDGKPRVALLRLEPGFEMDAHSHATVEHHYVLEGMYESQGREHPSGTYSRIPRQVPHGPFRSKAGALVLVFWEA